MHNLPNSNIKIIPNNSSLPKLERSHVLQLLSPLCIYCSDHNHHQPNQLLLPLNQPKFCKIQIDTLASSRCQLQRFSAQVTTPVLLALVTSSLILNS